MNSVKLCDLHLFTPVTFVWFQDMCQGYEFQHKFLTKEILELNDLRKDDLAREKKLMM